MKYLKVWVSFREALEEYSDAEKGRLFDAMLAYAADGTEPHFSGNEKYIWGAAKQNIDATREASEKRKAAGSAGGNAAAENREAANDSKTQQNIANDSKPQQNTSNLSSNEKKRKEKKYFLEDEEDDEEESSPRDGSIYNPTEVAVFRSFEINLGRIPNPAEVTAIAGAATVQGFTKEMAALAVKLAGKAGARNVTAYAQQVLQEWKFDEIQTPDEAMQDQYMRNNYAGPDDFEEARQRRKEAHEKAGDF